MSKKTKLIAALALCSATVLLTAWQMPYKKGKQEYYKLTVYHFSTQQQEQLLDEYLQNALVPALHRQNIQKVGVFKALANDTAADKTVYVLVTVKNLEAINKIEKKLLTDAEYKTAATAFINVPYTAPAYNRMEVLMLKAFSLAPELKVPNLKADKKDRVYELRSYESASEKIFKNKVHMFNEGDEISLFSRLGFNAVFYSEVIAGGKMPNLMYMTSFENMQERNTHWKAFSADSGWKKLSAMPMYQKNVSHIDIIFLRGVAYSDL